MSLENVKAFYDRMATDEDFRNQIQTVTSREDCQRIVLKESYIFTEQEFEEYTAQLLDQDAAESQLKDLDEKELEVVVGGVSQLFRSKWMMLMYGVVQPYGVVIHQDY